MLRFSLLSAVVTIAVGCQNVQVQKKSNELVTTVPDLYYQEVVDNLAMSVAKPGSLPYFCLPTQGTETNTRTLNASYTPGWDFITNSAKVFGYLLDKQSATLGGTVANAEAYQLQPICDPDKLFLLQIALRIATGQPVCKGEREVFNEYYDARSDVLPIYFYYYHAITNDCLHKCGIKNWMKPPGGPCPPTSSAATGPEEVPAAKRVTGKFAESEMPTVAAANENALEPLPPLPNEQPYFSIVDGKKSAAKPAATNTQRRYQPPPCPDDCCCDNPQPASWFGISVNKHDVPRCACYVGHCCNIWVWVLPENTPELTRFSLALIDIASIGSQTAFNETIKPPSSTSDEAINSAAVALAELDVLGRDNSATHQLLFTPLDKLPQEKRDHARQLQELMQSKVDMNRYFLKAIIPPQPEPASPPQPLLPNRITPFPYPAPPQ